MTVRQQRVLQPRNISQSLCEVEFCCCNAPGPGALGKKGIGNRIGYCDWFHLCYAQNTPMSNEESKYKPFL